MYKITQNSLLKKHGIFYLTFSWSHSKLNAEKSLTLFSALFFYLFQGLKWEKRGDEW